MHVMVLVGQDDEGRRCTDAEPASAASPTVLCPAVAAVLLTLPHTYVVRFRPPLRACHSAFQRDLVRFRPPLRACHSAFQRGQVAKRQPRPLQVWTALLQAVLSDPCVRGGPGKDRVCLTEGG